MEPCRCCTLASTVNMLQVRWFRVPRLRARDIDGFLRREAGAIEAAVRSAVTLRRMLDGVAPDTAADFDAYAEIVAHERPLDAQPDSAVVKRMARRIDRLLAQGETAAFALREQGREFVDTRAEALLLRHNHGWDAVALYLRRPAIAVSTTETVIAVRTDMGGLYMHPMWRMTGALNHLACNMFTVEARVQHLHGSIDGCLLYTSPSPRDRTRSRMPSSA